MNLSGSLQVQSSTPINLRGMLPWGLLALSACINMTGDGTTTTVPIEFNAGDDVKANAKMPVIDDALVAGSVVKDINIIAKEDGSYGGVIVRSYVQINAETLQGIGAGAKLAHKAGRVQIGRSGHDSRAFFGPMSGQTFAAFVNADNVVILLTDEQGAAEVQFYTKPNGVHFTALTDGVLADGEVVWDDTTIEYTARDNKAHTHYYVTVVRGIAHEVTTRVDKKGLFVDRRPISGTGKLTFTQLFTDTAQPERVYAVAGNKLYVVDLSTSSRKLELVGNVRDGFTSVKILTSSVAREHGFGNFIVFGQTEHGFAMGPIDIQS